MTLSRRRFTASIAAAGGIAGLNSALHSLAAPGPRTQIATNTYPWLTFARRSNEAFKIHSDELLAAIASAGINGYEPIIGSASEMDGLGERLSAHGLEMKSIYVNSDLHEAAKVDASIESVLTIAEKAAALGTMIVVTNPSPIRWGGTEDKSDQQLRLQARSLDRLGAKLREIGVTLAYHNHDAELRQGAREFHHMLTGTESENVKFCLDAHWVYRGCGDSEVAVFDVLERYIDRIVELHLRQSVDGVWTEAFALNGDIDYRRLFDILDARQVAPRMVLEQAVEARSPDQFSAVDAHREGRKRLERHAG